MKHIITAFILIPLSAVAVVTSFDRKRFICETAAKYVVQECLNNCDLKAYGAEYREWREQCKKQCSKDYRENLRDCR